MNNDCITFLYPEEITTAILYGPTIKRLLKKTSLAKKVFCNNYSAEVGISFCQHCF